VKINVGMCSFFKNLPKRKWRTCMVAWRCKKVREQGVCPGGSN